MRIRPSMLVTLLAVSALAGCVRAPYEPPAAVELPQAITYQGPWASLEEARIRPGMQVFTPFEGGGMGACTSNFLFRTPDNATLYLGVAAHCFGEDPAAAAAIGTKVQIGEIERAGRIAYNGWLLDPADHNDFGLVELRNDAAIRSQVNPAMLYYGGPTGLLAATEVRPGTHVLTYGHSIQRPPDDPENPREGYVLQHDGGRTTVVTEHPGIQGDSGSGLMSVDGLALGVLSMGTTNPTGGMVPNRDFPSVNYYVDLDQALAFAQANGTGLEGLEVVTADMLAQAVLPL